jgi:nuclear receptor co-repressor 1
MEKFAEKKRYEKFKERVIALKFKALHHLWKEDMRLLSVRKCRPKSHKKNELGVRTTCSSNMKNRSSIRSRFPFPGMNLSASSFAYLMPVIIHSFHLMLF